jgi:hypothetical protein
MDNHSAVLLTGASDFGIAGAMPEERLQPLLQARVLGTTDRLSKQVVEGVVLWLGPHLFPLC